MSVLDRTDVDVSNINFSCSLAAWLSFVSQGMRDEELDLYMKQVLDILAQDIEEGNLRPTIKDFAEKGIKEFGY